MKPKTSMVMMLSPTVSKIARSRASEPATASSATRRSVMSVTMPSIAGRPSSPLATSW